jgi:hypothetical protein
MADLLINVMNPRRMILWLAALVLAVVPLIPAIPVYWVTLLDNIGLAALVVIGLVLLTGVGGMTSFGQATFCGFGAYATALLTTQYGVSPWLTLFAALAVTLVVALALGFITLKSLAATMASPGFRRCRSEAPSSATAGQCSTSSGPSFSQPASPPATCSIRAWAAPSAPCAAVPRPLRHSASIR